MDDRSREADRKKIMLNLLFELLEQALVRSGYSMEKIQEVNSAKRIIEDMVEEILVTDSSERTPAKVEETVRSYMEKLGSDVALNPDGVSMIVTGMCDLFLID